VVTILTVVLMVVSYLGALAFESFPVRAAVRWRVRKRYQRFLRKYFRECGPGPQRSGTGR